MVVAIPLLALAVQIRYIVPWPEVPLIKDATGGDIVSAISERRRTALRRLATPDPLLTLEVQFHLLEWLATDGIITDEEAEVARHRAELICGDERLERPLDAPGDEDGAERLPN